MRTKQHVWETAELHTLQEAVHIEDEGVDLSSVLKWSLKMWMVN